MKWEAGDTFSSSSVTNLSTDFESLGSSEPQCFHDDDHDDDGGEPYSHTCFHKGEPVTALEGQSTEKGRDPLICPRNDPLLEKPESLRWKQF